MQRRAIDLAEKGGRMNTLDIKKSAHISRVESVADPEVNKALFQLYSNLVEPLHGIEQTLDRISSEEATLASNDGDVLLPMSTVIAHAVHVFPKVYLLVFIVIFALAHVVEALDMDILPALILFAVIAAVVSFVWCYVKDTAMAASRNKERKKAYDDAFRKLSELNRDLDEQVDRIKTVLQFVPPKYRFSDALRYFVESYQNSRVDDLKEAVNAYDTYYFRSQTVQMQQKLLEQERQNGRRLDQIAYNQLCMMEQLDGIRRDLW